MRSERRTNTQLSEKKAKLHVAIIGIFYLSSGIWEYLMAASQAEGISPGTYFLLDIRRSYLLTLSLITILVGAFLLCRLNFARLSALVLTWWNLFSGPLIDVWSEMYRILIIKATVITSLAGFVMFMILRILACIMVRLYIINMLKTTKAGYIF